jgi:hypothetical protein
MNCKINLKNFHRRIDGMSLIASRIDWNLPRLRRKKPALPAHCGVLCCPATFSMGKVLQLFFLFNFGRSSRLPESSRPLSVARRNIHRQLTSHGFGNGSLGHHQQVKTNDERKLINKTRSRNEVKVYATWKS